MTFRAGLSCDETAEIHLTHAFNLGALSCIVVGQSET